MNKRQKQFALEYSVDHNGAAAAVRAGYSERRARHTARELLLRPDVAAEVSRLGRDLGGLSLEELADEFLGYHEGAKTGRYPASVGIRGLEGYAKMKGAFVERRESVSTELKVWTLHFDRDLDFDD